MDATIRKIECYKGTLKRFVYDPNCMDYDFYSTKLINGALGVETLYENVIFVKIDENYYIPFTSLNNLAILHLLLGYQNNLEEKVKFTTTPSCCNEIFIDENTLVPFDFFDTRNPKKIDSTDKKIVKQLKKISQS